LPTTTAWRRAALVLVTGLVPALAGCDAAPPAAPAAVAPEVRPPVVAAASRAAPRPAFGDRVTALAAKYQGTPYVWGGTTPRGFDCSGFTRYVYARFGKKLPRVSADQFRVVRKVGRHPQKGELVFFHTRSGRVHHVGIYAGGGKFWHAPNPRRAVALDDVAGRGPWTAGRY
jgi:peptidoglycan DL-endopeptidase CwlO